MVSIQHDFPPLAGEDNADIQHWLAALSAVYSPAEIALIRAACEFAAPLYHGQAEATGTPLLRHALGSASILIGMHLDHETIAATVLHAVPDYLEGWSEVLAGRFGRTVTALVEGISRVERVRLFSELRGAQDKDEAAQQIESLRKMLLAMVEDIRVVLIKLAERTQTLRNLSGANPEQQEQIAQETQSIFAPLANRLGVWQIKWELEDLSLRYLQPALYKKVAGLLDERRMDRERYIEEVIAQLKQKLDAAGIPAEVTGRPKHIHSIINKMRRKQVEFGELYDVRAVRILTGDIQNCYAALSVVHELWPAIASEFDDYIANPKGNEIAIFKDRIEIYNPGNFPDDYSPADFIRGSERSVLRNPLIANAFYLTSDIERWGSGLKRINDMCHDANLKVDFKNLKTGFLVTFWRPQAQAFVTTKEVVSKGGQIGGQKKGLQNGKLR